MSFGSTESGLKKISAEKLILRNINALERSIAEEHDEERKKELEDQLGELKAHLQGQGGGQTKIKVEVKNDDSLEKLYRVLLAKHAKLINEKETKTVGEIKALVNRDDLTIQSLAKSFSPENYRFENHFFQAAEKAYNYIVKEIGFVELDLPISFWLSMKEIASEKIGDDEDQAVFLCSLLYALGDEKAEVVIAELENGSAHAFVITEFHGKFLLLDPTQGKGFREFYGEKNDVLEKYSYRNSKIKRFLYKFNNANYEQFATGEE